MDISLYRAIPPESGESVFLNSVSLMNVISHEIEEVVIRNRLPVDFYAGFQRFSYFVRQVARYRRLAAVCRRIYVWGVPDIDPPAIPGVEFIPISPDMDLAREWFLIVDSPQLFTALLTREQTFGQDLPKGARRFEGLWTYDADLVGRAYLLVSQVLGQQFRPNLQRSYESQSRFMAQISNRLVGRQDLIDRAIMRSTLLSHSLAAAETPLIVLDQQQSVIAVSQSAASLLKLTPDALRGQALDQIAGGSFADLDLYAPEPATVARLRGDDGTPVAASAVAIPNKYGDPIGYLVTLHTSQAVREQVRQQSAAVLPVAPMLQKYLGGIQQLLAMMPSLTTRQDVQLRVVGQMQRMVGEMNSQVGRLRLLQELESQAGAALAPTSIAPIASQLVEELRPRAAELRLDLQLEQPDMLPLLAIDGEQIRLALRELLDNALRYTPAGGAVRLRLERRNGAAVLAVIDGGPGLSPDLQARLGAPAGGEGEISGLGLPLARAIARAHKGQLILEPAPIQGSIFSLRLPIA